MFERLVEGASVHLKLFGSHFRQSVLPTSQNALAWFRARAAWWRYGSVLVGAGLLFIWVWRDEPAAQCDPEKNPEHCDLSIAWRHSISKLGIRPLYPPSEDIHVGDVYLVLVPPPPEFRRAAPYSNSGRHVRVHRYDMSKEIDAFYRKTPVFSAKGPLVERDQNGNSPPLADDSLLTDASVFIPNGARRELPIVAFPTLEIEYKTSKGAAVSFLGFPNNAQASRTTNSKEVIRIPEAESYGVPATEAIRKLEEFCIKGGCGEERARYVLEAAVGREIAGEKDNCKQYVYDIEIQLINQVTLTRAIFHEKSGGSNLDAKFALAMEVQHSLNDVKAQVAAIAEVERSSQQEGDEGPAQVAVQTAVLAAQRQALDAERARLEHLLSSVSKGGTRIAAVVREDRNDSIMLHHTFERPVAIGFDRVSFVAKSAERKKCRK
jgi:hypothetical protein